MRFEHQEPLRATRREFLCASASAVALAGMGFREPTRDLRKRFRSAIKIEKVELIECGRGKFVRVTSEEGELGVVAINNKFEDGRSIFDRRIAPYFTGKDAREIEELVDGVALHRSNYKFAGMPFWNGVAHLELAVLDMLGRIKKCTAGELLGKVRNKKLPVYATRFNRDSAPIDEVREVSETLERTGARAAKFKVGLRMRNSKDQTRRDLRLVELARKKLGDDVEIYVDANGSYDSKEAIELGREFEKSGVAFLEEPCHWEDYEATRKVNEALDLAVAGGEQDSSMKRLREMVANSVVDIVQPDIYYCGGLIRSLRVAELAKEAGARICPHNPRQGAEAAPALHLASLSENFGPALEMVETGEIKKGYLHVPDGDGLGLNGEIEEWRGARVI